MRRSLVASIVLLAITVSGGRAQTSAGPAHIAYGPEPTSFGELLVPPGTGPFPVAVLLHGGCWVSTRGDVAELRPMAKMLADHGIASWNLEYRRVGHPGGGWPGTYRDLSAGLEFVTQLAGSHPLDLARVVLVGHSSGGYFAAWLAGRQRLPVDSPLRRPSTVKVAGLVLLDSFLDPRVIDSRGVDGRLFCDAPVLPGLVGGDPDALPDRLRQISPLSLLPFGVPQQYVVSSLRYPVTPPRPLGGGRTTLAVLDYPALARAAGDTVTMQLVPEADHFDFIKPATHAWVAVETALVRIFQAR